MEDLVSKQDRHRKQRTVEDFCNKSNWGIALKI